MQYMFASRIVLTEGKIENATALLTEKRLQIGLKEKI